MPVDLASLQERIVDRYDIGADGPVIGRDVSDLQPLVERRDSRARLRQTGSSSASRARIALPHQQGAVAEVAARPDLDIVEGVEKGELDAALLTFLGCDPLLVLLRFWTLRQFHCEDAV